MLIRNRLLLIVASASGAIVLACGVLLAAFRDESSLSDARFLLVLKNALAVANPDYEVNFDFTAHGPIPVSEGRAIPVVIEAQGGVLDAPEIRWRDRILLASSGDLQIPDMPDWGMTFSLEKVEQVSGLEMRGATDALLSDLPSSVMVRAVVRLKKPLREELMEGIWPSNIDVILLSPEEASGKRISWDGKPVGCESRGFKTCDDSLHHPISPVHQFRRWVGSLRQEDDALLHEFGLDLARLRTVGDRGEVFGFAVTGAPDTVRALFKDPRVDKVEIAALDI
ncbi:hypothetical protein ACWDOR_30820 [Streptosporangium canum]